MRKALLASLLFLLSLPAGALTRPLVVDVSEPETMDAERQIQWTVTVTNNRDVPVRARTYIWPSVGMHSMVQLPEGCLPVQYEPTCAFDLAPHSSREVPFVTRAVDPVGTYGASAEVLTDEDHVAEHETIVFGQPYLVTTTADRGPGSLRQAITDINRDCQTPHAPCSVLFAIDGPVPPEGWFTIHLDEALPEVTAEFLVVDGRSQKRHTGDTNAGPEILIDGTGVPSGHGLALRGSSLDMRDVAIGGFPENGIDFLSSYGLLTLRRVSLGVDASGLAPLPNGYRGVQASTSLGILVTDSILSANGRAGAWLWSNGGVTVRDCKVGVGADGVTPMGNGASGLFFHNPHVRYQFGYAYDNVIAYNGHAGIGLTINAGGDFGRNVMHHNRNGAIDVALDGPTLNTKPGLPSFGGIIGAPAIESAKYENGVTTITGRTNDAPATVQLSNRIYIYAAPSTAPSGLAEAAEVIAAIVNAGQEFTVQVNRDLRGQYVSASVFSVFIYNWDDPAPGTSEVGLPRRVE